MLEGKSLASSWFLVDAASQAWSLGRVPGLPRPQALGLFETHRVCFTELGGCPSSLASSASSYHGPEAPSTCRAPRHFLLQTLGRCLCSATWPMAGYSSLPARASWADYPGFLSGTAAIAIPVWRLLLLMLFCVSFSGAIPKRAGMGGGRGVRKAIIPFLAF